MMNERLMIVCRCVVLGSGVAICVMGGCDREEKQDPQAQHIQALTRQLRNTEAELEMLRSDYNGVLLILLAFGGGGVGMILLLVKEHRSRRVLIRLVRMMLHRTGKEDSS